MSAKQQRKSKKKKKTVKLADFCIQQKNLNIRQKMWFDAENKNDGLKYKLTPKLYRCELLILQSHPIVQKNYIRHFNYLPVKHHKFYTSHITGLYCHKNIY